MEKNECQNEIRMFIHEVPGVQGISCAGVNIQLSPVKVFQKIYHIKTSNTLSTKKLQVQQVKVHMCTDYNRGRLKRFSFRKTVAWDRQ